MAKSTKPKRDHEADITNKILAIMDGDDPLKWIKPWRNTRHNPFHNCNAETGHQYRSINAIVTAMAADEHGYTSTGWLTFNQARKLGGMVRKGERGTPLTFSKKLAFKERDDDGADTGATRKVFMRKFYTVFNVAQIDGLPDRYYAEPQAIIDHPGDAELEAWAARVGADIRHGGNQAFYKPKSKVGKGGDFVQMPLRKQFKGLENYYSTLFHELAHWTGATARLDRDMSGGFGSINYAKEEFVAEIGSVFLAAHLGVEHDLHQTAAYLDSWRQAMRDDKRFIFTAASAANRAAQFLIDRAETCEEISPVDDAKPADVPSAHVIDQPVGAQLALSL